MAGAAVWATAEAAGSRLGTTSFGARRDSTPRVAAGGFATPASRRRQTVWRPGDAGYISVTRHHPRADASPARAFRAPAARREQPMSSSPAAPPAAPAVTEPSPREVNAFYQSADALCRCAMECCRQHERFAHLVKLGAGAAEQRAARTLVTLCDDALADLAAAYERTADRSHPDNANACWHAANGLWLASREFARRSRTSARAARALVEKGDRTQFSELALDYDLEASALLLLKQATEAYRRARPEVG
jgi:hypothetical protein